jgi:predicted dehydrogenase
MKRLKVGIVGVGNISAIYLKNLTSIFSNRIEVLGCADLIPERAKAATDAYALPKEYKTTAELYADSDIDIVVNLTNPEAHYEVCLAALEAGKHAHVEKPLSIKLEDGERLVALASEKKLRIGGAPDTFLGGGIQTCRKLIDDGWIGEPVAATAFMVNHGHESWHPDPEFYYKTGGGPMFDMGPYYLTALVNLIGPVKRITGSARVTYPKRKITSEPKFGQMIDVDVPTHVTGVLDFHNGAIGTIITSFDVWGGNLPQIEIYGSDGSLSVPDPNIFGGEILVKRRDHSEWHPIPWSHGYTENSRGLGIAELADAIVEGRPHRASGDVTFHVLEIMHGVHIASESGTHYEVKSSCARPDSLPSDF